MADGTIFLAMSLRNVGSGIGVLHMAYDGAKQWGKTQIMAEVRRLEEEPGSPVAREALMLLEAIEESHRLARLEGLGPTKGGTPRSSSRTAAGADAKGNGDRL